MDFEEREKQIRERYDKLINTVNTVDEDWDNGVFDRYRNCVLTAAHVPPEWRYDFNKNDNPYLLERIGVNSLFNAGALEINGEINLAARIEGYDRKSFFAVAKSKSGVDGFRFEDGPADIPALDGETNIYDMRLTQHEDGYIYGIFCSEKKDPQAPADDCSAAVAECGVVRTSDMKHWERFNNIKSSFQQRNIVLHPEFVNGKYALYTRPSEGFIETGEAEGIGFALTDSMENAVITEEKIVDKRIYHTIKESKNGEGAPPIKTKEGWLHIAHGVRNTAAGLRYVLYCFMTDINEPYKVIYAPGGYFLAPYGKERTGDVSDVVFCNGAVKRSDGTILIYYASSDTRLHVARTTEDIMTDYCRNTPPDGFSSRKSAEKIRELIRKNAEVL